MTHGHEKSDPAIVAEKSVNKDGRPSAESMEPRAGAEGNTIGHGMRRTPGRESMSPPGWIVYGKRRRNGNRNGSPPCYIMSMSNCCGRLMAGCGKRRRRVWTG
jgi:hypothetical protein